jgi:hypothetical protein
MPGIGTVDLGCIACLLDPLGKQEQADVLHSTLLAQLVADKKQSRTADPGAWFGAYGDMLSNVFWSLQSFETKPVAVRGRALLLQDVVQPAVAMSADVVALLAETLTVFRLLAADADPVMRFNTEVTDGDGAGNLQVMSATGGDSGPTMCLVNVVFKTGAGIRDPLVEALPPADGTTVSLAIRTYVLDEGGYAGIRASVDDKLGDKVRTDILPILQAELHGSTA